MRAITTEHKPLEDAAPESLPARVAHQGRKVIEFVTGPASEQQMARREMLRTSILADLALQADGDKLDITSVPTIQSPTQSADNIVTPPITSAA